jgi:hypothetical protein
MRGFLRDKGRFHELYIMDILPVISYRAMLSIVNA